MNYTLLNPIGALASACLLVVACGDNSSSSNDASQPPSLPPSSAPVSPANQPPTISGVAPNQATVGQQWSFQPNISNPDGDNLNVYASNLPGWISLDSSTGRLSGTPTNADVQTWSGISVSVSDGHATVRLPVFTIDVMAQNVAIGSATLSWLPPTENEDGSPIAELAGYRLLYGQASGNYSHTIDINNPGITRYMIEGLTNGVWFFAIQTIDANGLVSEASAEASKSV